MATVRKITKPKAKAKTARTRAAKKPARKTSATRAVKPASSKRLATNGKSNGKLDGKLNGNHATEKKLQVPANQKDLLAQERAQVENELANLRAEMQQAPEMTGDEVDLNVYEREKTFGLIATYERRLEEIDTTLKVAAEGKYGICERCGATIDPERLKIFPETRLCVSCKNLVEREQRRLRI